MKESDMLLRSTSVYYFRDFDSPASGKEPQLSRLKLSPSFSNMNVISNTITSNPTASEARKAVLYIGWPRLCVSAAGGFDW